jgi:hypothetical protein
MNGEQLYFTISQMTIGDRKIYLKTLTDNQRLLYTRYSNKMRQQKFNENPANKQKLNDHRKEYIATQRKEKPEEFKQKNIKDVKAFREREKAKLNEIEAKLKATETFTKHIKAVNARKEVIVLKAKKTNEDVKDILNDIIETIPKQADLKKKRLYMREYRAKKKAEGK